MRIIGSSMVISGVFPLLEMTTTTSCGWMIPKSPWMASAACMKMAGVPVEFSVATIFCPMMALFPIPVTIMRPSVAWNMVRTLSTKPSSTKFSNKLTAVAS